MYRRPACHQSHLLNPLHHVRWHTTSLRLPTTLRHHNLLCTSHRTFSSAATSSSSSASSVPPTPSKEASKFRFFQSASPSPPPSTAASSIPPPLSITHTALFIIYYARRACVDVNALTITDHAPNIRKAKLVDEQTSKQSAATAALPTTTPVLDPPLKQSSSAINSNTAKKDASPNVILEWHLICTAWIEYYGAELGWQHILSAIRTVGIAASGSNAWDERTHEPEAPPPRSTVASVASRVTSFFTRQKEMFAMSNPLTPLPSVASPKRTCALFREPIAFRLSPDMLEAVIVARLSHVITSGTSMHPIGFSPGSTSAAATYLPPPPSSDSWIPILMQLEPYLPVFNLKDRHPLLLRYFHIHHPLISEDVAPYLQLLKTLPCETLPTHCAALARIWDISNPYERARCRELLIQLMRMTIPVEECIKLGMPIPKQVLKYSDMQLCIKPFMEKLAERGMCLELDYWLDKLCSVYPEGIVPYHDHVWRCSRSNVSFVEWHRNSGDALSTKELEMNGYATIEAAWSWCDKWSLKITEQARIEQSNNMKRAAQEKLEQANAPTPSTAATTSSSLSSSSTSTEPKSIKELLHNAQDGKEYRRLVKQQALQKKQELGLPIFKKNQHKKHEGK